MQPEVVMVPSPWSHPLGPAAYAYYYLCHSISTYTAVLRSLVTGEEVSSLIKYILDWSH